MPQIAISILLALVQNLPAIAAGVNVVLKLARGEELTPADHAALGQAVEAAHKTPPAAG